MSFAPFSASCASAAGSGAGWKRCHRLALFRPHILAVSVLLPDARIAGEGSEPNDPPQQGRSGAVTRGPPASGLAASLLLPMPAMTRGLPASGRSGQQPYYQYKDDHYKQFNQTEWLAARIPTGHSLRGKTEWLTAVKLNDHSLGNETEWLTAAKLNDHSLGNQTEWLAAAKLTDHSLVNQTEWLAATVEQTGHSLGIVQYSELADNEGGLKQIHVPESGQLLKILLAFMAGAGIGIICAMYGFEQSTTKDPPAWNPDHARTYPFRDWASDLLAWSIASPIDERRKAAAVRCRLQGPAKTGARSLPPQALVNGGVVGGRQLSPMSFLMHSIAAQWGDLGEETALFAIMELNHFERLPGETTDSLISRFELIRDRASTDGQMEISIRQAAVTLLTANRPNR